jgi:hypothetical protein
VTSEALLLIFIGAASIDRHLVTERVKLAGTGTQSLKPGTLLKSQLPVRGWADR